jgi:hypothetical protein
VIENGVVCWIGYWRQRACRATNEATGTASHVIARGASWATGILSLNEGDDRCIIIVCAAVSGQPVSRGKAVAKLEVGAAVLAAACQRVATQMQADIKGVARVRAGVQLEAVLDENERRWSIDGVVGNSRVHRTGRAVAIRGLTPNLKQEAKIAILAHLVVIDLEGLITAADRSDLKGGGFSAARLVNSSHAEGVVPDLPGEISATRLQRDEE